ncbi:MAG: DUF2779 domain-containing protein [Clostridia bacterium]|nr:DUF2779 domain-containing protein [Clostridia bacterium]
MPKLFLSKSKYCQLRQCPKLAWLSKYKPEEQTITPDLQARFDAGNEIGDLAMGLFGDFVEVTAYDGEKLDLARMIERTKEEMDRGTEVICEASFSFGGLYCAVDILKRENGGWAIYEVKSSTHANKDVYAADVAYQKYVLTHCGVNVTGTYVVVLNSEYVFDGTLDINGLFRIEDVSKAVEAESREIESVLALGEKFLLSDEEPAIDLSEACNHPYACPYWDYCTRDLPKPNVFDLYRMDFATKIRYYLAGAVSYQEVWDFNTVTNRKQIMQMDFALNDRGDYIDREGLREFLSKLSYPLYFLDFETVQYAVPRYVGTSPFSQIPFQYSLHYIEREGGELQHREFLAEAGTDPRRAIAERLCEDIPMGVCVTAYNKSFECGKLKDLAELFPDLATHLLDISGHIVDLITPFQSGLYYNRAMGGSFSIKSVLPALFPDEPSLDYHNLEDIHNGSEAMNAFPAMEHMPPEELERTRRNLLKYCELDTFAMVKVWEKLKEAAK